MTNKRIRADLLLCAALLFFKIYVSAQSDQTINSSASMAVIEDVLEEQSENESLITDYSDLADQLRHLSENPVNLNSGSREELENVFFLNSLMIYNLIAYRETYGQLLSIYELQAIEGFDLALIRKIESLITVAQVSVSAKIQPGRVVHYGKHRLLFRVDRVAEAKAGYSGSFSDTAHTAIIRPYLGSPERVLLKYGFRYKDRIRIGFIAEKDPGECFLPGKTKLDKISQLPAINPGFDYYSGHFVINFPTKIKTVILGDYHLQAGQGLTMWTGYGLGKTNEVNQVQRMSPTLRPHTGTEENHFLRGVAGLFQAGPVSAVVFFSRNHLDATISKNESGFGMEEEASPTLTGYHRTIQELQKKNSLRLLVYGSRLVYSKALLRTGITVFKSSFDTPLAQGTGLYKQINFSGSENLNIGFDYHFLIRRINFFGEFSLSRNGGFAMLHGLNALIHPALSISLLYRRYEPGYQNYFSNPFASGTFNNETGIYLGMKFQLSPKLLLQCLIDNYTFPWLKFMADGPSRGREAMVSMEYLLRRDTRIYFRYRMKVKQQNFSAPGILISQLIDHRKSNFRFVVAYPSGNIITMANRIEFVLTHRGTAGPRSGFLVYHDVRWSQAKGKMQLDFRFALFDTDSYDERIYSYEKDVLSAYSAPAYFDRGTKLLVLIKYPIKDFLVLWFRCSRTWYLHKREIGTGPESISGNAATNLKIQLQLKLG